MPVRDDTMSLMLIRPTMTERPYGRYDLPVGGRFDFQFWPTAASLTATARDVSEEDGLGGSKYHGREPRTASVEMLLDARVRQTHEGDSLLGRRVDSLAPWVGDSRITIGGHGGQAVTVTKRIWSPHQQRANYVTAAVEFLVGATSTIKLDSGVFFHATFLWFWGKRQMLKCYVEEVALNITRWSNGLPETAWCSLQLVETQGDTGDDNATWLAVGDEYHNVRLVRQERR